MNDHNGQNSARDTQFLNSFKKPCKYTRYISTYSLSHDKRNNVRAPFALVAFHFSASFSSFPFSRVLFSREIN